MTREEAYMMREIMEDIEVINKIYDDFESRTCENCKHYKNGWHGVSIGKLAKNHTIY